MGAVRGLRILCCLRDASDACARNSYANVHSATTLPLKKETVGFVPVEALR
jgi:hypothetical protein